MKLIGLTGGIASGKSLVASIFEMLEVPVLNADLLAKKILNSNDEVKARVKKLFGHDAYTNDRYNASYVRERVFENKILLQALNQIVHPEVALATEHWKNLRTEAKYGIKEAAIMIESGAYKLLDGLICINAPLHLRKKRALSRDGITAEIFDAIVTTQFTDEQRSPFASHIITNNEEKALLPQVISFHQQMNDSY